MIWGAAIIILLLTIILAILFHRMTKQQAIWSIEKSHLSKIEEENISLHEERIELMKKVESLSTSLKLKEESHSEVLQNSKSVLYDLSSSITKQLIDVHKKEVEDARKQSEERITRSTESFNNELQKVANLVGALNKDVEASKAIVDNLKNALLSPSSSGMLAEVTLENLLKNSGLKKDIDYSLQLSFDTESNRLRPDALIYLPDDSILIIDAKSSQFLLNAADDSDLVKSMNNHLKSLCSKDYKTSLENSLSKKELKLKRVNTVMFIPTEQSLEKVSNTDRNFMQKAWENNIYPAGPSGLLNILSVARMHIGEQMRMDNYEKIIHEVSRVIASINMVTEHAFKLGNSISSIVSNYDKFAASFNRNLISKVSNLKSLGLNQNTKTSKILERFQVISSKNDIIEIEAIESDEETNSKPQIKLEE